LRPREALRQEIQHGGADLVGTLCYQVSPPQNGVVTESDKASIRYTFHDVSYPLRTGPWLSVETSNLEARRCEGRPPLDQGG
jgi:hypothetical protein